MLINPRSAPEIKQRVTGSITAPPASGAMRYRLSLYLELTVTDGQIVVGLGEAVQPV